MRRIAVLACLALVTVACSDDESPASTGNAPAVTDSETTPPDAASATTDVTAAPDPGVSDGDDRDAESPSESDPSVEPPASGGDDPTATPEAPPSDDTFGDFLIADDEVDDDPFCRSFADVFNVFIGISFVGVFGQLDETLSDGDGDVAIEVEGDAPPDFAETLEVALYPSLLDDVDVIEAGAPPAVLDAFRPLFERVRVVPGVLIDAGFTGAEVELLAAAGEDLDETAATVDDGDPRLAAAAALLVERFGSFEQFAEELNSSPASTDPQAEDAAQAFFDDACPLLASSLDA